MKKTRHLFPPVLAILVLLILHACGEDHKEPVNNIKDSKGIRLDLSWNTNSNTATALAQADLDLDVHNKDGREILSSYNKNEFERVDLTPVFEDGVYTVKVSMYEISKKSKYTLKISGLDNNKTFTTSGYFEGTDAEKSFAVVRITKNGDQFTMSPM